MENKYYIPHIDEFTSDFHYEYFNGKVWVKSDDFTNDWDYEDNPHYAVMKGIDNGIIRVKYLDSSDIEELGFKLVFSDIGIECWKLGNFELRTDVDLGAYIDSSNLYSIFYNPYGKQYNCVFSGTIKNKSELKKVLNMLNIK